MGLFSVLAVAVHSVSGHVGGIFLSSMVVILLCRGKLGRWNGQEYDSRRLRDDGVSNGAMAKMRQGLEVPVLEVAPLGECR